MVKRYLSAFAAVAVVTAIAIPASAQTVSPFLLDNNNAGKEFFFSFPPAFSQGGWGSNDIKLYIASTVETDVTVEITSEGWVRNLKTIPNKVVELSIPPAYAQPYFKSAYGATAADQIYRQKAIRVSAKDPVLVYGATLFQNYNEGFIFLPVSGIGEEYIVSSYMEGQTFGPTMHWPSEVLVVAPFDGTDVTFTLGGNINTKTNGSGQGASGLTPGQSKKYALKRGDVLTLSSYGTGADLSGSKIVSSKPVSVITGVYCTYVPSTLQGFTSCNFLGESELPTHTWGTVYHVTKLYGRGKNSHIKIVAKEPDTKVYRNGQLIGTIQTAGGTTGKGYLEMRVAEGETQTYTITADKPISIMQYNASRPDDNIQANPFQMALTPVEQYRTEILFSTPGSGNSNGFSAHYLNLLFEPTPEGDIPDDLMIAIEDKGTLKWEPITARFTTVYEPVTAQVEGRRYGMKSIKLPQEGMYALRSSTPVGAYLYNAGNDPYGLPATTSLADRRVNDTDAPRPVFTLEKTGVVVGATVRDFPEDAAKCSNLASVYLVKDLSSNYTLTTGQFIPGQARETTWGLSLIDPTQPAVAVVAFIDRAGNDTTVKIEFEGLKTAAVATMNHDFGKLTLGNEKSGTVRITSTGTKDVVVSSVEIPSLQAFEVEAPSVPFTLEPGSYKTVKVRFLPHAVGKVSGNIVFKMDDLTAAAAQIEGEGVAPSLYSANLTFPDTQVGSTSTLQLQVRNEGADTVRVTTVRQPSTAEFLLTIPDLPAVIAPGKQIAMPVQFVPQTEGTFSDEVRLGVMEYEIATVLQGNGTKQVQVDVPETGAPVRLGVYPNPASDELTVSYELAAAVPVRLALYDALGAEVLVVAEGMQEAGAQALTVRTETLAPGVYFCRLTAAGTTSVVRVTVLR